MMMQDDRLYNEAYENSYMTLKFKICGQKNALVQVVLYLYYDLVEQ